MYNAYEDNTKMINHQLEERRAQLARTYGDGQSDAAAIRLMIARTAGFLGDGLHKISKTLGSGNTEQRRQEPQALRVRTDNGS